MGTECIAIILGVILGIVAIGVATTFLIKKRKSKGLSIEWGEIESCNIPSKIEEEYTLSEILERYNIDLEEYPEEYRREIEELNKHMFRDICNMCKDRETLTKEQKSWVCERIYDRDMEMCKYPKIEEENHE